jgi:iron complex outermembrane receptor protein
MNRSTANGLMRAVCAMAVSVLVCSGVLAQQPADTLQEIVVTAEKRTSTVQDTPISITAVTGKDIEARGLADFTALAQTVPGISMKSSGAGQTEFEMRGLTSSGGNSATVGFYLDDIPMSAPANAQNGKVVIDPNLYDLNRVEVLRGPQGTLYGSGSMGGTIKIVTNQPDPSAFDTSGKLTLSDTNGGGFNNAESAMVNFPLGGGVAGVRIVGSYEHDSGWIDRVVIAPGQFPLETNNFNSRGDVLAAPVAHDYKGVNDEKLTGVRISMLLKPIENLSIAPGFFYQEITQGGLSDFDSDPGTLANYQPYDLAEPFTDRIDMGTLNVQYHFGPADLTSVTSYWTRDSDVRQDGSEELQYVLSPLLLPGAPLAGACSFPFIFAPAGTALGPTPGQPCSLGPTSPTPLERDASEQWTEELRLASAGDTDLKWLVGYFYQDFTSHFDLYVPQPDAASIFGTGNGFTQLQPTKIVQNAFFGEISYRFLPQLTGTVGLRHYSYSNEVRTAVSGFLSSTGTDMVANSVNSETDSGLNPKFNLSYEPNKDLLLYATASKGFRPGGANQPVPTSGSLGTQCEANLQGLYGTTAFVPAPDTFNPDSVWTYELGEKWRTNDSRLTLNGAVYYSVWKDAQQFVGLPCGFNFSTNTGNADIYGGELELNAVLAPGLVFSANGSYTDAKFVASTVLPGVAAANGLQVQDVPKYTSAVSLAYDHPISDTLALTGRIDSSYTASRTQVTNALQTLPSYSLTNVRLGVTGGKWTAVLFANNVFNKQAWISYAYQINVGIPTFQRVNTSQPLTIGVDFTYHLAK